MSLKAKIMTVSYLKYVFYVVPVSLIYQDVFTFVGDLRINTHFYGNMSRFFNHAHDNSAPCNVSLCLVRYRTRKVYVPILLFKAKRRIAPGEQLCYSILVVCQGNALEFTLIIHRLRVDNQQQDQIFE